MEIEEYFKRIELNSSNHAPTKDLLNRVHVGQLSHIPFETFDLIDLKELNISIEFVFDQLVRQKRGGVCYQLNGLLAFVLKKLGYHVQFVPCGVRMGETSSFDPDYSHAALCVTLDNGEQMLCDVGFSRDYLTPIYFRPDCVQFTMNGFFRLRKSEDDKYYLLERGFLKDQEDISLPKSSSPQTSIVDIDPDRIKWMVSYRFGVNFQELGTQLEDYQSTCPYIIHSPNGTLNHWTICRIHVDQPFIGSRGIVGKEYCEWKFENGIETRTAIPISNEEVKSILKDKFNVEINRNLQLVSPE